MGYLKVYTKSNELVYKAVDATFDALCDSWILDPKCLAAIKAIDSSVLVDEDFLKFQSPYGIISPRDFSSGVKSLLLLYYRIQNSQLLWIPSLDSMGNNAKDYAFENFLLPVCAASEQDFPIYCTILDMSDKYWSLRCKDCKDGVRALADIICEV